MSVSHKNIIALFSLDNILDAWKIFRRGKTRKNDVMDFEMHLEDNLFSIYEMMRSGAYRHLPYKFFQIFDGKKRDIYKAEVRDRIIHQIIYDYLLFHFDKSLICDSYASRIDKGQYRAIKTLRYFIKLATNQGGQCFVLKCDVKKYFDHIDQGILLNIIEGKISCDGGYEQILEIIREILFSYNSHLGKGKGVPLGNVTSQIFANIYLNVLDQYMKQELKCRYYVRYNDDLIIVSNDAKRLEVIRNKVIYFVRERLHLEIPFEKTSIRKISWGVEFLGATVLPEAILLRDKTKNKIYANIKKENACSYLSILKHCNSFNLRRKIFAMEKFDKIW